MTTRPIIKPLRQVLVLLHMATAFGWLASSAAMLLLITHALGLDDLAAQRGWLVVAAHLDDNLLADFSFMTVYTGLMLAGLTSWGYTRFWWVTVKLTLALACALGGRAIFTGLLAGATTPGRPIPGGALVAVTVLMMVTIALLAWVARTKPWGPIGQRRRRIPVSWAHPALWILVIVTPVADYVTDLPLQAIPAAIVIGHHVRLTVTRITGFRPCFRRSRRARRDRIRPGRECRSG